MADEMNEMANDVERILYTSEQIEKRIAELGKEISKDYVGKTPVFVCMLKGAMAFCAELIKHCDIRLETQFMHTSSYGKGTTSSGVVAILHDLTIPIEGRDVLIVEDIIDSGYTLDKVLNVLKGRGAKSIKIACLLSKPQARRVEVPVDYVGFEVGNEFVIGFGFDYGEIYRNLPYIGILKKEVYTK